MGISSYTSEHPLMGIDMNGTKGIFTKFNYDINSDGNSDGLCYSPKKDKNAVPYTFTRYVGVKVINGLAFQLEEAPKNPEKFNRGIEWYTINNKKVGTSKQDLCITKLPYTVNSIAFTNHSGYRDTNITVKYSGDITASNSIDDFKIRYYDSGMDYFYYIKNICWVLTSELVGFYDGIGNYNDWLFTVLLDFDIYPLKIGDKSFYYFDAYKDQLQYYLHFYTTDAMMNLFKKLYNHPLYAEVKEELKKQYPNEDYFELYNTEKNAKLIESLSHYQKSYHSGFSGNDAYGIEDTYKISKLSFKIKECTILYYIYNNNPRKEVIDSFITYVNKIAERTKKLTYQEVMAIIKDNIRDIVTEYKTRLSSYTHYESDGDHSTSYHTREELKSKLICYKKCKDDYEGTLYFINDEYKYGDKIWKEHNPNTDNSEYEKHKDDEFFINNILNDFVYGLTSGNGYSGQPERDTYFFDMAWITHGIPLK